MVGEPRDRRRAPRQALERLRERQCAGLDELDQRERQGGLEPEHARWRLLEGQLLRLGAVRGVVGGDRVDRAIGEPRLHRGDVRVGAQRWVDLEDRIERRARGVREREVVRRRLGGDRQAARLRAAHELHGTRRGEVQEVEARPGGGGEDAVTSDDDVLGRARPSRDPEPARPVALVHVPAAGEAGVLRVLRDHRPGEGRRVLECRTHHTRRVDAGPVVREDPHAERVQLPHRRELAPLAPLRDRARGADVAARPGPSGEHCRDHGRVVVWGRRVRHGDDRGEAAERRGAGTGLDGLGVLHARLPEVHVQIDEPRRDHAPRGVEDTVAGEAGIDGGDPAVRDEHVRVTLAVLVDDTAAPEHERVRQPGLPSRGCGTGPPCGSRRRWRPAR